MKPNPTRTLEQILQTIARIFSFLPAVRPAFKLQPVQIRKGTQTLLIVCAILLGSVQGWGQNAGFFTSPTGSVISYTVNGTATTNRCYGDIALSGITSSFTIDAFSGFTWKTVTAMFVLFNCTIEYINKEHLQDLYQLSPH
jgi:hypothetical protein